MKKKTSSADAARVRGKTQEEVAMAKRHSDALAISNGACNPSGIARSLVQAIDECRADGADTNAIRADPAIYLIVSQLAYLCGVWDGVAETPTSFYAAMEHCQRADAKDSREWRAKLDAPTEPQPQPEEV